MGKDGGGALARGEGDSKGMGRCGWESCWLTASFPSWWACQLLPNYPLPLPSQRQTHIVSRHAHTFPHKNTHLQPLSCLRNRGNCRLSCCTYACARLHASTPRLCYQIPPILTAPEAHNPHTSHTFIPLFLYLFTPQGRQLPPVLLDIRLCLGVLRLAVCGAGTAAVTHQVRPSGRPLQRPPGAPVLLALRCLAGG